ncbi:F-box/LRR-repeat protein 7-like isoform X2 [Cryptotermes secundus]|nr:F-box/LRR-repeat protein 7-like isoform X2 [Cryptotermes secundus]XP_023704502.1 F-box/LRR-repeat protein 7-like isoform X2 [Cryptotermes secundus]XP_023704504.1 F-box/LRR-repeat protein 7-like isoform X2 [Cryptotermes secundus]XP_023704505.1 F-box/LRR-repeat protein 7-like isoform X2 [Cryptotermes secundus]XP_023704506.1 F-box/LRR-repeat protein 7-like isoform X2 [Cryptotermes secundus]XP_023704507.1 F-box/LRR-repeat protein 7-like isoform X2 [Cryptotermes secundus]XP_023704508.1 F-box/LR
MKRMKYQREIRSEGVRVSSPELPEGMYRGDTRASSSPDVDVRYHLRNRTIFDFRKCEKRDASDKNVSMTEASSVHEMSHCTQTKYCLRNVLIDTSRSRASSGIPNFTPQLQTVSTDITHSINETFEHEPSITRLPNELLTMIFSYLNVRELSMAVAPVCKQWYLIAHSPVLWRKLCFSGDGLSTENAKCLLTKSPLLAEVIISNRDDVEELISQLCTTNRSVESVAVKRCSKSEVLNSWEWALLHARHLNRLIKCCPKIRRLKLNEVCIRSNKFYHDLGILLPNLTCLHLSHNHFLTPRQIKNIATNCHNLAQLWISGENCCGQKEDWESAYKTLFQQRWRTLTHLQFDASKLTDDVFKELSLCVNLKILHLHRAVYLFCLGMSAIGTLPNLISLRLHKAKHLSSDTLLVLYQNGNFEILVNLSLAGCSCVNDECAAAIALHCRHLHLLSLALVEGITDKGIEAILKHCTSLHYLDIYCMKNVTGSSFSYISHYARELNFLVVEESCSDEKEKNIKALLAFSSSLKVHRTQTWKTGGTYRCKLLQYHNVV